MIPHAPSPGNTPIAAAERLRTWGFVPIPVQAGTKRPALTAWAQLTARAPTPDEIAEAERAWQSGRADRIALLHKAGLVCLDFDPTDHANPNAPPVALETLHAVLTALGLPPDYAWAGYSQSNRGGHIWLICPDAPTAGGGVVKLQARPEHPDVGAVEIRFRDCYTILPHRNGVVGYCPQTLDAPPAERRWRDILEAIMLTVALPPVRADPPRPAGRVERIDIDAAHTQLDQAFDAAALAAWFGAEYGAPVQQERNGEWRVLGQGGLLVRDTPAGARWYCFTDHTGGGWVTAVARTRFGGTVPRGKDYIELLRIAADFAGVTLPVAAPAPASSSPSAPSDAPSIDAILTYLNHDEAGDAQLFAALHAQRYRYDHAAGQWYEFRNHVWRALPEPPRGAVWGATAAAYLDAAAALQRQLGTATQEDQARLKGIIDALTRRARDLRKLKRINNVLVLAAGMELLGLTGDEWDRDPWALAVANGVLDLRTGMLRAGQPDDYIRTQAPTEWHGIEAQAPHWERFISDILGGDDERIGYLQRLLGYACNGLVREHILVLLVGPRGRNGKGTLYKTLERVLGPYAGAVHTDVIVGQAHRSAGQAQPHVMSLRGLRLAFTSETNTEAELDAAQVKRLTGGDRITARNLHQQLQSWEPTHTLFVATNRRPHAPADDDALWERVHVLEFPYRYVDEPSAPDERRRDPALDEKLAAEGPGILAWLVRGGLEWQRGGLRPPASVRLARDSYRRSESIEPFLEEMCICHPSAWADASELYDAYKEWAAQSGISPKSLVWFGKQLKARFESERGPSGRQRYIGIAVRDTTLQTLQTDDQTLRSASESEKSATGDARSEEFDPLSKSFSMPADSRRENIQTLQTLQTLQTQRGTLLSTSHVASQVSQVSTSAPVTPAPHQNAANTGVTGVTGNFSQSLSAHTVTPHKVITLRDGSVLKEVIPPTDGSWVDVPAGDEWVIPPGCDITLTLDGGRRIRKPPAPEPAIVGVAHRDDDNDESDSTDDDFDWNDPTLEWI